MIAELARVLEEAGFKAGAAFWPVSGGPDLEERVRRLVALAGPLARLREWAALHPAEERVARPMEEVLAQTEQAFRDIESEIDAAEEQGQEVRGVDRLRAARALLCGM